MDFKNNLQKLRCSANLTQEQLAEKIFVSRVTISKWETGRGYPNIDSLKLLAKLFDVSIDELLSTEQIIEIADKSSTKKITGICSIVFGLLDFIICSMFVLPIFLDKTVVDSVALKSLLELKTFSTFVQSILVILVSSISIYGVLELALQSFESKIWIKFRFSISFILSVMGLLLFILTFQQNPAIFMILVLIIKVVIFINVTKSIRNVN